MASNYKQKGDVVYAPAPSGGVVSGMGYIINDMFGIAQGDADAGVVVAFYVKGIFELPKKNPEAWNLWEHIYWHAAGPYATNSPVSGDLLIGIHTPSPPYTTAAASSAKVGDVRLNQAW